MHRERVLAATDGQVALAPTRTSRLPGAYGLAWPGGFATLGPAVEDGARVVRPLLRGATPPAGARAAITSELWRGDPADALGRAFVDDAVPGPLGTLSSWRIPGGTTWAVIVHGRGVERYEGLRIAEVLADLGLTVALPVYRNDPGAPASPDGLYHLGDTEWEDVRAVVAHARAHGAERLVLIGHSTGGAIVQALLDRAPAAEVASVVGTILDAPVLDWRAVIRLQARLRRVPAPVAALATRSAGRRAGIDWDGLDVRRDPGRLRLPTLLILSDGRPHGAARACARARRGATRRRAPRALPGGRPRARVERRPAALRGDRGALRRRALTRAHAQPRRRSVRGRPSVVTPSPVITTTRTT